MNARNLDYVRRYNHARGRRLADQKLRCKVALKKNTLPVSALIAKISTPEELEHFNWQSLPESFALKPNRGFGGEGIVVVYARKKGRDDAWVKADGSVITVADLKSHIQNILDGSFSLSNKPDIAFFEERLKLLKLFKPYTWKGIPDIRIIVFNRVPVMAMLRLPTKDSGGKANLHQGAIGVGIDMANGTTTTAIVGKGRLIEYVPETRLLLSGLKIPRWKDILTMAVKAQEGLEPGRQRSTLAAVPPVPGRPLPVAIRPRQRVRPHPAPRYPGAGAARRRTLPRLPRRVATGTDPLPGGAQGADRPTR